MSKKVTIIVLIAAVLALAGLMTAVYTARHASSASVVTVKDSADFQAQVKNSTLPVFIVFTASDPACAPCQKQDPLVEQAAKDYAGKVKFIKVDVTKTPEIAVENGISAVPAMFVMKLQEKTLVYYIGFLDAPALHQFIEDGLKAQVPPPANPGTNAPSGPATTPAPATPATPDTNSAPKATDPTQK